MTDNEIIKALECCTTEICWECPFEPKEQRKGTIGCCEENIKNALDLINRQKAEIEMLENQNNTFAKRFYKAGVNDLAQRLKEVYLSDKRYDRPHAHTLLCKLFDNIDTIVEELGGTLE